MNEIRDADGRLIRGTKEIMLEHAKGYCPLCDKKMKKGVRKTNEHVIPNWMIKRFNLSENSKIVLPNDDFIRYGRNYGVPLCNSCNGLLNDVLEKPISTASASGPTVFEEWFKSRIENKLTLYVWMAWIMFKLSWKDHSFPVYPDPRKSAGLIGESYDYDFLFNLLSVVRACVFGCSVDSYVMGSLFGLPMQDDLDVDHQFDLVSFHHQKTLMITFGGYAFFSVFEDYGGTCAKVFGNSVIGRTNNFGDLSPPQVREAAGELVSISAHIKRDFVWELEYVRTQNGYEIILPRSLSEPTIEPKNHAIRAPIMEHAFKSFFLRNPIILHCNSNPISQSEVVEKIKEGSWTFLKDENGDFLKNSFGFTSGS